MNFSFYNAGMFIKPCYKNCNGKKLAYWAFVKSYGKPQFVQARLFNDSQLNDSQFEPEWVEMNANGVRI